MALELEQLTGAVVRGCPDRRDGGSSGWRVGPLPVSLYCWSRTHKVMLGVTVLQKPTENLGYFTHNSIVVELYHINFTFWQHHQIILKEPQWISQVFVQILLYKDPFWVTQVLSSDLKHSYLVVNGCKWPTLYSDRCFWFRHLNYMIILPLPWFTAMCVTLNLISLISRRDVWNK